MRIMMWVRLRRGLRIYTTQFVCYALVLVVLTGHFFLQSSVLPQGGNNIYHSTSSSHRRDLMHSNDIQMGFTKAESVVPVIPNIGEAWPSDTLNEDAKPQIKKPDEALPMHLVGLRGLGPTAALNNSIPLANSYNGAVALQSPVSNQTLLLPREMANVASEKSSAAMYPPENGAASTGANTTSNRIHYYYNEGATLPDPNKEDHTYLFNCTNVHHIIVKRKLGHGVSKQVLLGTYNNKKVGVKMVTRSVLDVTACVKRAREENGGNLSEEEHNKCFVFPNMKLMKEILLLQQLHHPNLLKMLGYCVRSEETLSTSLQEHGVVAVYEYALRFYLSTIRTWPMHLRVKTAYELADLLNYMENSPLGSLRIADFKDAHFLLKDGKIKLTDLDDVSSVEPSCIVMEARSQQFHGKKERRCKFGLKCIGGICPGHNAKANLDNMNRLFFSNLLGTGTELDPQTNHILMTLTTKLNSLRITAGQVKNMLSPLLNVPYDMM